MIFYFFENMEDIYTEKMLIVLGMIHLPSLKFKILSQNSVAQNSCKPGNADRLDLTVISYNFHAIPYSTQGHYPNK